MCAIPANPRENLPDEIERVYDQCVEIFLREGYECVTLEELENKCGVPKGILTSNYESKESLTAAAMSWYYEKYSEKMETALEQYDDIYPAVRAALYAFAEFNSSQVEKRKDRFVRGIIDISRINAELNEAFENLQYDWEQNFIDKFKDCQDQLVDPLRAEGLAQFYLTTIEGLYEIGKAALPLAKVYEIIDLSLDVLNEHLKHPHSDDT